MTWRTGFGAALCGAALLALAQTAAAEPQRIKLLLINDWDRFEEVGGEGGFARVMAAVEAEGAAADDVLLIHAGDAISPSLLSGFDQGAHMVALLNELPLDVFVLGNHEFDFGPEVLAERIAEARFDIVNSNVFDGTGELLPGTIPNKTIEVAGFKLGFYGLTTPDTVAISSPGDSSFAPVVETAQAMQRALREDGADLIVAVVHTGRAEDQALFDARVADLILTGHDHDLRIVYDGRTAMAESFSQGIYVTAIELEVERVRQGDQERIAWRPSFRTLHTADFEPSPRGLELVKPFEEKLCLLYTSPSPRDRG
jgi:2',3'-cyclic-nucleotide 2'-phosphodiesterase (5'-nucleotidase family)